MRKLLLLMAILFVSGCAAPAAPDGVTAGKVPINVSPQVTAVPEATFETTAEKQGVLPLPEEGPWADYYVRCVKAYYTGEFRQALYNAGMALLLVNDPMSEFLVYEYYNLCCQQIRDWDGCLETVARMRRMLKGPVTGLANEAWIQCELNVIQAECLLRKDISNPSEILQAKITVNTLLDEAAELKMPCGFYAQALRDKLEKLKESARKGR